MMRHHSHYLVLTQYWSSGDLVLAHYRLGYWRGYWLTTRGS